MASPLDAKPIADLKEDRRLLLKDKLEVNEKITNIENEINEKSKEFEALDVNDLKFDGRKRSFDSKIDKMRKEATKLETKIAEIEEELKAVNAAIQKGNLFKHPNMSIARMKNLVGDDDNVEPRVSYNDIEYKSDVDESEEDRPILPHPNVHPKRDHDLAQNLHEAFIKLGHPNIPTVNQKDSFVIGGSSNQAKNVAAKEEFVMAEQCCSCIDHRVTIPLATTLPPSTVSTNKQSYSSCLKAKASNKSSALCNICGFSTLRDSLLKQPASRENSRSKINRASSCQSLGIYKGCAQEASPKSKTSRVTINCLASGGSFGKKLAKSETPCDSLNVCQNCGKGKLPSPSTGICSNSGSNMPRIEEEVDASSSCDSLVICGKFPQKSCASKGVCSVCGGVNELSSDGLVTPEKSCQSISDCKKNKTIKASKSCESYSACDKSSINNRSTRACESYGVCDKCANTNSATSCQSTNTPRKSFVIASVYPAAEIRESQRKPPCDSLNVCSGCKPKSTPACSSTNVCDKCGKKSDISGPKVSVASSCAKAETMSKCQPFTSASKLPTKTPSKASVVKPSVSKASVGGSVPSKCSTRLDGKFSPPKTSKQSVAASSKTQSVKQKQNCRPDNSKNPPTSGRTLLVLKKNRNDFDELQCPENPCEEEASGVKKTSRPRVKSISAKSKLEAMRSKTALDVENNPKPELRKDDKGKKKENPPQLEEAFSSKYKKMKYEIQMQNYLIDKMNRELQAKTMKCRPEFELCHLKQRLDVEVRKLKKMVSFAVCMQRSNPVDKWGPIPISTVGQSFRPRSRSCPEPLTKLKPPQTPSNMSTVSGFEALEDALLEVEQENCIQQKKERKKDEKIEEFRLKIKSMACKLNQLQEERVRLEAKGCNRDIKCEKLFGMSSQVSSLSQEEDLKHELQIVNDAMETLMCNVELMQGNVNKLHKDVDCLKQEKKR